MVHSISTYSRAFRGAKQNRECPCPSCSLWPPSLSLSPAALRAQTALTAGVYAGVCYEVNATYSNIDPEPRQSDSSTAFI
jgi:hypothetical protein